MKVLTDEEILNLHRTTPSPENGDFVLALGRAIEAKVVEKMVKDGWEQTRVKCPVPTHEEQRAMIDRLFEEGK